jgi:hypothetical protein
MGRTRFARLAVACAGAILAGTALVGGGSGRVGASSALPPVRHVFVINLENESYPQTWGDPSAAPYLTTTLRGQGTLLEQYYGVAHNSLPNYLAQISGQTPNRVTQLDCPRFADFRGRRTGRYGQALGRGCVYPARVKTLPDQLAAQGLTWKGYMEDMASPCLHPHVGALDRNHSATASGAYATRHNPFVYFHSIIDSPACSANDVPLDALEHDLASVATTANYSMITPDLCNDGHDETCPDGGPGGLDAVDQWLQTWVPRITASPAFRHDGLLVVTFDEAELRGDAADASECCDEPATPNVRFPGIVGPGGGRVGALVLSPYVAPGGTSTTHYDHYSLLRSIEDLFGLAKLGYAGAPGVRSFGTDVYARTSLSGLLPE